MIRVQILHRHQLTLDLGKFQDFHIYWHHCTHTHTLFLCTSQNDSGTTLSEQHTLLFQVYLQIAFKQHFYLSINILNKNNSKMSAQQMQQYHILCNLLTIRLKWDRTVSKSQPQLETAGEQTRGLRKLLAIRGNTVMIQ